MGVWTKKPVRAAGMARDGIVLTCCLDRLWGGRSKTTLPEKQGYTSDIERVIQRTFRTLDNIADLLGGINDRHLLLAHLDRGHRCLGILQNQKSATTKPG